MGLLTNNSTWCQNRGCICISSTRRTYGRIHSSFLHTSSHPDKYNNSVDRIISKEEEREDIQGEILQSSLSTVVFHTESIHFYMQSNSVFHMQSSNCQDNYSMYRINSTTRNLQEILQLQGSSHAGSLQGIFQ